MLLPFLCWLTKPAGAAVDLASREAGHGSTRRGRGTLDFEFTQVRGGFPRFGLLRRGGCGRAVPPTHSPRARSSASRRSSGSVGAHVDALAGDRMREGEPRGVQELALEPEPRPPRRTADRRRPDGRSPPCGRGSGACGRSRARPAAASRPGAAARSRSGCGPRAGSSVSIDIGTRSRRSRPIGASIVPVRGRRPTVDQRQVLAPQLARGEQRLQRAVDLVRSGDHEQPRGVAVEAVHDPGAVGLVAPGGGSRQRLRERPVPVAAGRMHDDPGRLVDDQQVLVLVGDRERHRRTSAPRRRGPAPGSTSISSPAATTWRLGRTSPSTRTRPASISRCARARDPSGAARNRSRPASPASSSDTRIRLGSSAIGSRDSSTSTSAITPNVIDMSATLNAGHAAA